MSRLTASPFHKPSPFEFPQHSASIEGLPSAHPQLPTPASTSIIGGQDPHAAEYFETPSASIVDPASTSRFRRVASSIVYQNSGLRESRERTVQRSSRSFVVVLPPPSLPQDHGHLGHTLSSGPRHRLSQGLLMPLFPTMYGQLTAIAREYNFPSTTGLCLYLHYTDNGITVTPRIADDSWQMIWSHAIDPAPNAPHSALPISGKIEFDIDMRLARWYGAWMASSHREHVDVPMSVTPSAAPSIVHYREESRTTFADGDDQDTSVARPSVRHIPRKLSLIDRFDTMSARSVPRSVAARPSPPEPLPGSQNLSPIFQEDEPKTAKYDLEHRVNTWRASASVLPGAIAGAGHILLAGANLPNSPPLDTSPMRTSNDDEQNEDEYRIEDYSFSISSAGPGDYDPYSPLTWYYDPSVDLAHRAQGSVCMTPSYCTSFGPSDYTLSPHVPSLDLDRVRTPDIAHRMFEDVPPSPSVATSWGAPLSYPPSPMAHSRPPSVHLGDRQHFSRPVTPMTATSWGAPESFPPSPTTPFYVHTPDAGQRTFDLSALSEHDTPWSLVWPYHDATRHEAVAQEVEPERNSAAPWNMVWPYHANHAVVREMEAARNSAAPWNMVWPYHSNEAVAQEMGSRRSAATPWNMVWPYNADHAVAKAAGPSRGSAAPWNLVWPYHGAGVTSGQVSVTLPAVYPSLNIYPAVYPHFDLYPAASGAFTDTVYTPQARGPVTVIATGYPVFNLYPGYPANLAELYPANVSRAARASSGITTRLAPRYPSFDLYPAVYPHFDLYPAASGAFTDTVSASPARGPVTIIATGYPVFNLYPGYPANLAELYPAHAVHRAPSGISTRLAPRYPSFDLYPAVYPHIVPYPSFQHEMDALPTSHYPHFNLYPAISTLGKTSSMAPRERGPVSVLLRTAYPVLNIYPAIYPTFDLYPGMDGAGSLERTVSLQLNTAYPIFNLYPAVYPDFDLYPALPEDRWGAGARLEAGVPSTGYPNFNLYPAVSRRRQLPRTEIRSAASIPSVGYPDFDLYPAVSRPRQPPSAEHSTAKVLSAGVLSASVISAGVFLAGVLSAGYPDFDLYPAVSRSRQPARVKTAALVESVGPISVRMPPSYPMFELYPPVYPVLDIYPGFPEDCAPGSRRDSRVTIQLAPCYPIFNLYPAVYPTLEIYPALPDDCSSRRDSGVSVRLTVAYPIFNLYPAVYPCLEIYPSLPDDYSGSLPQDRSVPATYDVSSGYPHFNLYPPVGYPYFNLYPEVSKAVATQSRGVEIGAVARYPAFDLYPAVYPFFELYPGAWDGPEEMEVALRAEARYPYFNLYPAIYPHFELWPTLSSMQERRVEICVPKQSRFTSSDLHALVKNSPMNSRTIRGPSNSHQVLHLAVFPKGADVLTPSGSVPTLRAPSKTHLDLHHSVFPSGVEVFSPSGTGLKDVLNDAYTVSTDSPPPRLPSRLRSGSVLRMSLPPSPRPVGGRSPTTRAQAPPPNIPIPEVPTDAPRRTISTPMRPVSIAQAHPPNVPIPEVPTDMPRRTISTPMRPVSTMPRPSVVDRATPPKAGSLTRSVSMASRPSAAPEPSKLDRTSSVSGPRANKRDSLVLQRVRALQMNTEPTIKEDDPISSFPLPPRASVHPPRKVVS
ncbi:hypothetical protein B0H19DRAFT_1178771 [Mycena capillaripes]|nr:hypothetical protein B0H19DRAFT_1178771 [Mycena capillaripes]